jgi:AraC-like DNA-binding protein
MVRGSGWLATDLGETHPLQTGDVVIVSGGFHYTVSDEFGRSPQVIIHPGQRCTTPDGESVTASMTLGVRTWGNDPGGATVMLTGTYTTDGEVGRRLLESIPPVIVVEAIGATAAIVDLLSHEIDGDLPGHGLVLDRLVDLLLIGALRTWFAKPHVPLPAGYAAMSDPVIGPALRLIQHEPHEPWTVALLARRVGMSRASFAARFAEAVGEPPMRFLNSWRLALAADLLRDPDVTVSAVAREVGFTSPYTFSTAFKRHYGKSPSEHRRAA